MATILCERERCAGIFVALVDEIVENSVKLGASMRSGLDLFRFLPSGRIEKRERKTVRVREFVGAPAEKLQKNLMSKRVGMGQGRLREAFWEAKFS